MARTLQIRKPTVREIRRLDEVLESECAPQVLRRAHVLLEYADGLSGTEIAAALGVHPNTVYADLQAFDEQALACLCPFPHGGAPARLTPEQIAEIARYAQMAPHEFGVVDARWTLSNFCEFLVQQCHLVATLSREHLRRVLKKRTFAFAPCSANWSVMIHSERRF
jgi:transposase